MSTMTLVTDQNLALVAEADCAALILTKSDCGHCFRYAAEIEALARRGVFDGVKIGKLVLDQRGAGGFKRDNPWIAALDSLPYTLLYRAGRLVDAFAASRASFLTERLEDLLSAA